MLGRPWINEEFADAIGVAHATLRKWLSGARRPKYTIAIEKGFFGSGSQWEAYRRQLRAAHEAARRSRTGAMSYGSYGEVMKWVGADAAESMRPLKYQSPTQLRGLISEGKSISLPVSQGMTADFQRLVRDLV
jgi:hypothetical protein